MTSPKAIEAAEGDRWDLILELIGEQGESVLDIGCRERRLAAMLPSDRGYVGLDLFPPADVIASAEDALPFDDDAFDTVVLADVLEHLNHPHAAFDEALRVARRSVVVLLPNVLSLTLRAQFALGRLPAKYAFGPDDVLDRHRWLMNFDQAALFARERAARRDWVPVREHAYTVRFGRRATRAAYRFASAVAGPNLWAWEYAARFEPAAHSPSPEGAASPEPANGRGANTAR